MGGYLVASAAHALGIKKAKEMWMLCRRYTAQEALQMGLVNAIVPLAKLEEEVDRWCDELLNIVPTCLAIVKKSFRAVDSTMESESNKAFSLIAPDIPLEALWEKLGSGEVKPSPQFLTEMAEAQKAFFEKRTANFWKRE
jgi:hypothetical protein